MSAVIRALLNIKATGLGVTKVTIWSDSKIVVQGLGGLMGAGRGHIPKGNYHSHQESESTYI
eukprot:2174590-Karenia_brevis.AAC.1